MQENEFEKRVQDEMAEFRLRPSEAVWEKVEVQLKKKKRRRVVFLITMLAGLSLLGYSGYFITKTNAKKHIVQQDKNTSNVSDPAEQVVIPVTPSIEKRRDEDEQANREQMSAIANDQQDNEVIVLSKEKVAPLGKEVTPTFKPGAGKFASDNVVVPQRGGNNKETVQGENSKPAETIISEPIEFLNDPANQTRPVQTDIARTNLPVDLALPEEKKDEQISDQRAKLATITDSADKSDPEVHKPIASTRKKEPGSKIKWGIDLSGGISSSRNNAFALFDMQKSADLQANSPTNSNGGGFGIPPRTYPSEVKAGPAFRAGIVAEKKLSKRSSLVTGLQYLYHSTSIHVGAYKDTLVLVNNSFSQDARVEAIYRGTLQKNYTNRFHFIQVPVQYQLQLNKGVKTSILWSVGMSAGYLLSTNGLVYDTAANGIYYRDKAAFNKFQLNLTTGLSFRFGNKNKIQWSLGPEFSLGMNKLMKDDYTKKQYLLYSGLTGRLFFQKRNR